VLAGVTWAAGSAVASAEGITEGGAAAVCVAEAEGVEGMRTAVAEGAAQEEREIIIHASSSGTIFLIGLTLSLGRIHKHDDGNCILAHFTS
jgi:tetrahydromethanopterin S-methyltransferase subunit D